MNGDTYRQELRDMVGADFGVELSAWIIILVIVGLLTAWTLQTSPALAPAPALPSFIITAHLRQMVEDNDPIELSGEFGVPGEYAANHTRKDAARK